MNSNFLKLLYRSRLIKRWSGTECIVEEDVAQHSHSVAIIAYLLCDLMITYHKISIEVGDVVLAAIFHDCSDTILTHIISPVKNNNIQISKAVNLLKQNTYTEMINMLPCEMQGKIGDILYPPKQVKDIIEIADNIDEYCKALSELERGNLEFQGIYQQTLDRLKEDAEQYPFVAQFISIFLEPFKDKDYKFRYLT